MARNHIDIKDLHDNAMAQLTEDDLSKVTGGIALLLPAVQKVRDAASRSETVSSPYKSIGYLKYKL